MRTSENITVKEVFAFDWLNPRCNSLNEFWYEEKFGEDEFRRPREYMVSVDISENFPVEWYDEWQVLEHGKIAERWRVTYVDNKHRYFEAAVTEIRPEE